MEGETEKGELEPNFDYGFGGIEATVPPLPLEVGTVKSLPIPSSSLPRPSKQGSGVSPRENLILKSIDMAAGEI